jgi:putative porin
MRNQVVRLTFASILCSPLAVFAQGGPSPEIAALRAEIAAMSARLDRLEREQGTLPASASTPSTAAAAPSAPTVNVAATPAADSKPPSIRFAGDLRYRHETVNDDAFAERQRHRIRARFGVTADVTPDIVAGLTLATGGEDPVSANQTLDDGFNRKSFGVDRAYFTWKATDDLSFTGGKMANPFFRPLANHLIYDNDLNPEGLSLHYETENWFANFAGLWVEERAEADDSILMGGQFAYKRTLDGGQRLVAGVSYYDYRNTQSAIPFWDGFAAGNTVDASGLYANDFNEAELFAELKFNVGDRPITVFADYVTNTEAALHDEGYAFGAAYGEITRPGTWRLSYAYQKLEADAVIGTFTDSDFAGGGTDGQGHVVDFQYGLRNRWTAGFRYFLNERGQAAGSERDYNRLQADVNFNY